MSDNNFIHLHVHTEFSLLDGLSRINKLVNRAKELNMDALAITDHGTMFGVMDFYDACKTAGIKPIIGVEAYLARRGMEDRDPQLDKRPYHMLLLAKNDVGYKNLLKITSAAQLRGYYYRPRIDLDFLATHSEGLIATSGCLAAKIPSMIQNGQEAQAREEIGKFIDIFGGDSFYLELQHHDIPEIHPVNKWLINYNREHHTHVGLVATNDVHYVLKGDFDIHDTLLCIQTSAIKSDTNRMQMSDNSYYLSSSEEMWEQFGEVPEAIHNSRKIAEMCDINLDRQGYHLPTFSVPEGHDAAAFLRYLVEKGLDWRFGSQASEAVIQKRANRELEIIHDMGFDTYFLIVWDLCQYARHVDIWWNVRGSGAGSLVAYSLGITNIDPLQNNLLFERFLNPGRVSMPDIDIDFPDDRRGEMIAYSVRKYGEDKVAAIITFGTLGAKAAVRDVGRALDVPLQEVNQAAALIPTEAKQKPLEKYVELNPDLERLYNSNSEIKQVIDIAKRLQGVSRHTSTHAAGVIIADKPLDEYIPLHRVTGKDPSDGALKSVTQFPMETCESIGLLKIDFLGLSTLTILRKAADIIERHRGIKYTMDNIPYRHDDPRLSEKDKQDLDKAFELIGRGETVGVFQVESSGMQQMLRDMRPKRFENIIAAVALYRPGPMEFIPQYNRRLHGDEKSEYRHKKLEPILAETYGIIVYQEQIMQIAGDLFDYELGDADLMRRAVSKKKEKDLAKHRAIFLEAAPKNNIDEASANKIFDDIEFFANYGFNKSHAADYAVITVQTAFLKAHYPEEYMTALLSVQRHDSAKVATFLEECRRLKIPILPPDVNFSELDFAIQNDPTTGRRGIRFGLAAIKNAGEGALQPIIDERAEDGEFTDLMHFAKRIDLRNVGKRTLESVIRVGAMSKFGKRSQLLDALERIVNFSASYHKDQEIGQMTLFGENTGLTDDTLNKLPQIDEFPERQMLRWEKELMGFYVTGRPVDKFRDALEHSHSATIQDVKQNPEYYNGKNIQISGEIIAMRKLFTRNGDAMAVFQVEDYHDSAASIEVVTFPRTWEKIQAMLDSEELTGFDEGEVIKIAGKFDVSRGDPQIICERVTQNFDFMIAEDLASPINGQMPDWADESIYETGANNREEPPLWIGSDPIAVPPQSDNDKTPDWAVEENPYDEETGEIAEPEPTPEPELAEVIAPATQGGVAVMTPSIEPQLAPAPQPDMPLPEHLLTAAERAEQRWIIIYFGRSGDDDKDRRRLARLHGLLVSYPGNDRFSIIVEGQPKSQTLEYPNHTTGYCEDLVRDLLSVVEDEKNIEIFRRPD